MSQLEVMVTTNYVLTIPDPDRPYGQPLYFGPAELVHTVLVPGTYEGVIENWRDDTQSNVKVYVAPRSTILGRFVLRPSF